MNEATAQQGPQLSPARRDALEPWTSGRLDLLAAVSEEIEIRFVGHAVESLTVEAYVERTQEFMADLPDLRIETEEWVEGSDTSVWRWRQWGTHKPTGLPVDLRGCTVFHFDGERVAAVFVYADSTQLPRQLGPS
jgi:ketosteroid isomerase-like protein